MIASRCAAEEDEDDRDVRSWLVRREPPRAHHLGGHRVLTGPRGPTERPQLALFFIFSLFFFRPRSSLPTSSAIAVGARSATPERTRSWGRSSGLGDAGAPGAGLDDGWRRVECGGPDV
jgi:hypothetical protein